MLKKEFSTREKVLILILVVIVIGICYFKFFLTPINDQVDSYNSMASEEQAEADENLVKIVSMNKMQKEVDELKAQGATPIPTYDNSSQLMVELNSILSKTQEYSLSFGTVTSEDYIMIRPVSMTFETDTYEDAREIIDQLYASKNLMQISGMSVRTNENITTDVCITNLSVTYFEVNQDYEEPEPETTAETDEDSDAWYNDY